MMDRALAKLPAEQQREAWKEAVETAPVVKVVKNETERPVILLSTLKKEGDPACEPWYRGTGPRGKTGNAPGRRGGGKAVREIPEACMKRQICPKWDYSGIK